MVPRFLSSSASDMPTPLSLTVMGACVLVKRQAYGQLVIVELDVRIGEAHEGELVDGVGGVGHELSQEDLLVV